MAIHAELREVIEDRRFAGDALTSAEKLAELCVSKVVEAWLGVSHCETELVTNSHRWRDVGRNGSV